MKCRSRAEASVGNPTNGKTTTTCRGGWRAHKYESYLDKIVAEGEGDITCITVEQPRRAFPHHGERVWPEQVLNAKKASVLQDVGLRHLAGIQRLLFPIKDR